MTAVKICGVTRTEDVVAVIRLGIRYCGFNFYGRSRRFIAPADARRIWLEGGAAAETGTAGTGPNTKGSPVTIPVGVLVDPTLAEVTAVVGDFPELRVLQFHGRETPGLLQEVSRDHPGIQIWKALPVATAADLDRISEFSAVAALVLLDSATVPAGADTHGGSGTRFDWNWLSERAVDIRRLGVAGGVTPANVEALYRLGPALIDVSSGVESAPGIKDHIQIEAVVRRAK